MTRAHCLLALALLTVVGCFASATRAQQSCPAPPALAPSTAKNIFTPQQEMDLGDVEAEQFERNVRVIHDDELTAYANAVANRIVEHLPASELKIRVILVDLPIVNAFSIAGGRIYVTRKAIAFIRNEDELAGMLGHEMGHALTHQQAIDMTRLFQQLLSVTSVGDRKDIFDKFNRFLDNAARNPKALQQASREEEPHQYQADEVALYAVAQAGYSPQSFIDFFDRLAQTQGKTGNWLTDFLGMTKPNEKRLRELLSTLDAIPPTCKKAPPASSEGFLRWQTNVIAFSDLGREEQLVGVLQRRLLDPPLRTDIRQLRFSPNGKYLFAQDEASIFVFNRDPLDLLMRIDARDARPAQFTPDSQDIVFDTRALRIEKWSIAEARRVDVRELTLPGGCLQTLLSHDGKLFACVDAKFGVSLLDVASGSTVFQKDGCFSPDNLYAALQVFFKVFLNENGMEVQDIVHIAFSPDDRYLVGGLFDRTLAVDTAAHKAMPVRGGLSGVLGWEFAFQSPDHILGANGLSPKDSGVFDFPTGHVVEHFPMGPEHFVIPTRGNKTVIISPLSDSKAGLVDLESRKILLTLELTPVMDVYDQTFAIERRTGDIGLFDLSTRKLQSEAALPRSPLGSLQTWAVSPDLTWLAMSGETRGGVWNLQNSKRTYFVRGFHGAYFDGNELLADFPKLEKQERNITRLALDHFSTQKGATIDDKTVAQQYGPYLLVRVPREKGLSHGDMDIEIHAASDNRTLWTRSFRKEGPRIAFNSAGDTLTLRWSADAPEAQEEIKGDAALKARFEAIHDRKTAVLLEVLEAATGKTSGHVLVDTGKGSFEIKSATANGDWVLASDAENRTHVYSMSSGLEKGIVFGTSAVLSERAGILAVENEPGQLDIYRVPSLEKTYPLIFPSPISIAAFSADGKKLLVLTANQSAYTLETRALLEYSAASTR